MNKPRILVSRQLPKLVESRLSELFDPVFNTDDRPLTQADFSNALSKFDAIIPTVTDQLETRLFSNGPCRTKMIANYGVGFSHIDVEAAKSADIVVTNTPDVLSECTADLAITLMLMISRRAGEGERELRSGNWSGWRPTHLMGQKLSGKTLGIIGFGRIGRETARRAHFGFGMKIKAFGRSPIANSALDEFKVEQTSDMAKLLASCDVVSLHCPGGEENRHLISIDQFKKMKKTAYIINTARGEVVDEAALAASLRSGEIAGAGLDVFESEPSIHPELLECENAVLLPHLGSATQETRTAMGFRVVENLCQFFEGSDPQDRVA